MRGQTFFILFVHSSLDSAVRHPITDAPLTGDSISQLGNRFTKNGVLTGVWPVISTGWSPHAVRIDYAARSPQMHIRISPPTTSDFRTSEDWTDTLWSGHSSLDDPQMADEEEEAEDVEDDEELEDDDEDYEDEEFEDDLEDDDFEDDLEDEEFEDDEEDEEEDEDDDDEFEDEAGEADY